MRELTQEERVKLARVWVWQEGQKSAYSMGRVSTVGPRIVVEGRTTYPTGYLSPDLTDPVTADGMPRTARAVWRDGNLFAMPSRAWKWKVYVHLPDGGERVYEGPTESDALLTAILAAPEPA